MGDIMKKEAKEVVKLGRMLSPATPFYLAGIQKASNVVRKFIQKPSFIDKLK